MDTESLINLSLGIKDENIKIRDYFTSRNLIPLGTRRPIDEYGSEVPEEDEVNIVVPYNFTSNPLNIAYIDMTGRRKTQLTKSIAVSLQDLNYDLLTIEAKSRDWYYAKFTGQGRHLHPTQENTRMKLVNYVPSFLMDEISGERDMYKFFSPNIKKFYNIEDWENLGVSPIAADIISSLLKKKKDLNIEDVKSAVNRHLTMQKGTQNSALTAISNLDNLGFFKYKNIPYKEEWEKGNNIIISFFGQSSGRINVIISKIIQDIADIGRYERDISPDSVTGKFIIFEDSSFYATKIERDNIVTQQIRNVHHNLRAYGISSLLIVQLPDLIDPLLIDGCSTKIVGSINNPEAIRPHIPKKAYDILKNEQLYIDEENFLFEKMLIQGSKVQRFFQYDCRVGHMS